MNIVIYQINMGRDKNRVAFLSLDNIARFQGTDAIDSSVYDKVYAGEVPCEGLEDVFRMFNVDHPQDYTGRSVSVSDVVEIIDENGDSTFHFCDTIGWKIVEFDPDAADSLPEGKQLIKVVLCEPGKKSEIVEIEHSLAGFQKVVGGDIEAFYPFEEAVAIVCNEEGKFNGMSPNRAVHEKNTDAILDVIFGTFFICDCSGEDFGSLSEEQLERYRSLFEKPEALYAINGTIASVPYDPEEETGK